MKIKWIIFVIIFIIDIHSAWAIDIKNNGQKIARSKISHIFTRYPEVGAIWAANDPIVLGWGNYIR